MAESKHIRALVVLAVAALVATLLMLASSAKPSLAAQEDSDFQAQIVNGQPADPGEYPAQGYLQIKVDGSYYMCGGTLVGERHFLTAAHCVVDNQGKAVLPGDLRTALGEVDRKQFTSDDWYAITAVDVHADYDDYTDRNDVAMLTLDRPANLAPMRVVDENETNLWGEGVIARIIGWGTTSSGGSTSNVLMEANVPMRSDAECADAYGSWFDEQTMVCAGNGTADTCQGDSGGPLLVPDTVTAQPDDFALAGLTSWGYGCNDPDYPGVYTRVGGESLNSWVHARIGEPAASVTTSKLRSANITVRFSEPMNADSLMQDSNAQPSTSTTIVLLAGGPASTTQVPAKVSCTDTSCQTVTLNPDARLGKQKTYTVKVEGAGDTDSFAVETQAGKDLAQDFTKSFKTGLK